MLWKNWEKKNQNSCTNIHCLTVCYLVKSRLLSLHIIHTSWRWHTSLSPVFSIKAIGWRRRSVTERNFTVGRRDSLFVIGQGGGGGGTSPCQRFLSVMDQLPVTQESGFSWAEDWGIALVKWRVHRSLTAERLAAPGCICLRFSRPRCGCLRWLCRWTVKPHPAPWPDSREITETGEVQELEKIKYWVRKHTHTLHV